MCISAAKADDNLNPCCQGYMGVEAEPCVSFPGQAQVVVTLCNKGQGGLNSLRQVLLKQGNAAGCKRQSHGSR